MADPHIQASFNVGEWAPTLNARVDLQKYHSAAALLQNWTVDYRGGASTRPGTKYIIQCFKSGSAVRLIPFQASFNVGYVLEFGDFYVRFIFNGSPILETVTSITAAASGPPEVFTDTAHGYANGDWIFVQSNYYIVAGVTTNTYTLTDLFGNAITTNPFTLPASAARIYTLTTPYAAADLALLKFAQNVSQLILCHPNYLPRILTLIAPTNWTLLPIVFGAPILAPTGITTGTTLSSGPVNYAYVVTAIDAMGNESTPTLAINLTSLQNMATTAGSNSIGWNASAGAVSYNVYKSDVSYFGVVPVGGTFGFIGNTAALVFIDTNIGPDFSITPPILQNPFQGSGVASVTVTAPGTYTTVPTITFTGASSTIAASASAVLQVHGTPTVGSGGSGYVVGDIVRFTNSVTLVVATLSGSAVATWQPITVAPSTPGSVTSGSTPANPVAQVSTSGVGTGATANLTWGVGTISIVVSGSGYSGTPTVTFSAGAATATAILGAASTGNPTVPGFFQQRLVLAAPTGSPQTFYMSQSGLYFNFDISDPIEADNAITASLVSGQLNTIKSMVPVASGLLMLTDKSSWLINGGSNGSAVTPSAIVANAQSFNGASDVPPIMANYDVLYVQAKGSVIRDNAYNIYYNVFTGTDISILSSHLFYGFTILEWAWAEEPFKIVWAIRNDGAMLTLTFLKEQDIVGWTHSITQGSFASVATVTENTSTAGEVDAVYTVVQRTVNATPVKYIERVAERTFPSGVADAWCVDAGIQYVGAPATNFSGGQHLAGLTVTGLADGQPITPFVMPANGKFTLPAASKVTVGLGYVCDLQTLALDIGEPTVQGKVKNIPSVDVRVASTLGLKIGPDFNHLVPMKDLVRGNVSSMLTGQQSQVVTDLVTGDASTYLAPTYTVPGQYCIRQDNPYPATVLGVIPNVVMADAR